MKLFQTIEDRIESLGFEKECEDKYGIQWVRINEDYGYEQVVEILRKKSLPHLIVSYDREPNNKIETLNNYVGLSYSELKLFQKMMKKLTKAWNRERR